MGLTCGKSEYVQEICSYPETVLEQDVFFCNKFYLEARIPNYFEFCISKMLVEGGSVAKRLRALDP